MGMSKVDVINVVMELYDARKEARDYLDYYATPNEKLTELLFIGIGLTKKT